MQRYWKSLIATLGDHHNLSEWRVCGFMCSIKIMICLMLLVIAIDSKDILCLVGAAWVSRYNAWCVCSTDADWYRAGCRCQLSDALLQDYGLDCNPLLSCNNIHRSLATCRHIPEGPVALESGKQEALNQLPATLKPCSSAQLQPVLK